MGLLLRIFRKYKLLSFYWSYIGQTRVKVCSSALQRDCGENHGSWYLARRTFGTRKLLLGILLTALCVARRCRTSAKLYVGAYKSDRTKNTNEYRHVDSCSLLSSLRDDLIIGRRTSTIERSIEMASDGRPGLYPGGKSPRRNQHDRGERPNLGVYVQCYRNHSGLPSKIGNFDLSVAPTALTSRENAVVAASQFTRPISSRGIGCNCFLLSKAHLVSLWFLQSLWCFQ